MLKNHLLQKRLLAYSAAAGIALTGGVALADTNEINTVIIRDIDDVILDENTPAIFSNMNPNDNPTNEMKIEVIRNDAGNLVLQVTPEVDGTDLLTSYCREVGGDNKPYEPGEVIPGAGACTALTGTYAISFVLNDIGIVNNGSIGVKFKINNNSHWGWIRFSSDFNSVTVEGYGYDSDFTARSITAPNAGPLAITLANFEATADATDVSVRWSTVSELDNLGFNLYRSTEPTELGTQVNSELIPSQGSGSGQGFKYDYLDENLETGTYFYTLEDVDVNGMPTQHGPISVTIAEATAVTLNEFESNRENAGLGLLAAGGALAGVALAARRRRGK